MMKKRILLGMAGCVLMALGDWLMLCADPTAIGSLSWLTEGVKNMGSWRLNAALALSFPAIVLYAVGLFSIAGYIKDKRDRRVYRALNAIGLTPWLMLHMFYVMIFGVWQITKDLTVCEQLFSRFSWIIMVSMVFMIPVYVYWAYLVFKERTVFPKVFALNSVLVFYVILKGITMILPTSAFRLGFLNGLMSESMFLFFLGLLIFEKEGVLWKNT